MCAPGDDARGVVFGRDLHVGTRYDLGSHLVTEAEIVEFAVQWDPQDFHVDAEAAEARHFGGIVASGLHTIGVYQRLAALCHLNRWKVIAGRGIRDLHFPWPVRPGDVLTGSFTIEGIRATRTAGDIVTLVSRLVNQDGDPVLAMTSDVHVTH
ncbi:MAG: dehydratase [Rhodococcus sp. (in: high G+C Gram-positive bacteria)]|nr:MAG: dehydratase [Rhodococcus sp. (in: high G+C Gram-positive bacteria)]